MIRAVVDTVVFVRGTLSSKGKSAFVIQAFKRRKFLLLTSRRHLEEIFHTLGYPRLRRRFKLPDSIRKKVVGKISAGGLLLSPSGSLKICRDPNDNYLIELALLGKADYLVTEDKDFHDDQAIVQFLDIHRIKLVTVSEFTQVLRSLE